MNRQHNTNHAADAVRLALADCMTVLRWAAETLDGIATAEEKTLAGAFRASAAE